MDDIYKVKTSVFEGPLDLLLLLIEKRKLFINDISLAEVADDYVAHIKNLGRLPVGDTANFILVASTLVLIKSKSLLPTLTITEEEDGSIEELEQRLREYARIRELSAHVKELFGKQIIFPREHTTHREPIFSPDKKTNLSNLLAVARRVIAELPKKNVAREVVVKRMISLEEMMENLVRRVEKSISTSFKEFTSDGKKERMEVAIGFLAMLELVKQGIIDVLQDEQFGDINIESREVGVPKYI